MKKSVLTEEEENEIGHWENASERWKEEQEKKRSKQHLQLKYHTHLFKGGPARSQVNWASKDKTERTINNEKTGSGEFNRARNGKGKSKHDLLNKITGTREKKKKREEKGKEGDPAKNPEA